MNIHTTEIPPGINEYTSAPLLMQMLKSYHSFIYNDESKTKALVND